MDSIEGFDDVCEKMVCFGEVKTCPMIIGRRQG